MILAGVLSAVGVQRLLASRRRGIRLLYAVLRARDLLRRVGTRATRDRRRQRERKRDSCAGYHSRETCDSRAAVSCGDLASFPGVVCATVCQGGSRRPASVQNRARAAKRRRAACRSAWGTSSAHAHASPKAAPRVVLIRPPSRTVSVLSLAVRDQGPLGIRSILPGLSRLVKYTPLSSTAIADGSVSPVARTDVSPPPLGTAATAPCWMVPDPSIQ